ncbi:MAG: phosphohydrolase, partial [Treponema sp.]|nr:phosphohydrolase [Treponema sp.]
GQLWDSDLTFRELQTIESAFVRVLAGHYHSRIEYPKPIKEALQGERHGHGRHREDHPEEEEAASPPADGEEPEESGDSLESRKGAE